MATISKTLTLTADDTVYSVADMSQPLRDMVALMDEWRQRELDLSMEVTMVRGALRDIQTQMLLGIRQEQKEKHEQATQQSVEGSSEDTPTP